MGRIGNPEMCNQRHQFVGDGKYCQDCGHLREADCHLKTYNGPKVSTCLICRPYRAFKTPQGLVGHLRFKHKISGSTITLSAEELKQAGSVNNTGFVLVDQMGDFIVAFRALQTENKRLKKVETEMRSIIVQLQNIYARPD